jgi:hypothetical protein
MVNNMSITHFTDKAFIITFEEAAGGFGCRRYGIKGIYNKKNIAEIAFAKLEKEAQHDMSISYNIKEVSLNDETVLFNYHY